MIPHSLKISEKGLNDLDHTTPLEISDIQTAGLRIRSLIFTVYVNL